MGKKVIRLTEADIEKIVRQVIEEQRRRVQKDKGENRGVPNRKKYKSPIVPDWNGKLKGKIEFESLNDMALIATNISKNGYDMRVHSNLTKSVLKGTPKEPGKPTKTLETIVIPGSSLPYADNMVKPDFVKYPEAKAVFDDIAQKISTYINAGGGDKLTNVTIKGSADSARPTTKVPKGYTSLDHPGGTPYGGKTDPNEMNQYLADTRASEYANALKTSIKELTNFDLNITVLPGDNYYGQEGKRGEEFRKITLTPNAPPLDSPTEIPAPEVDNTTEELKFISEPAIITYSHDGVSEDIDGYIVKENPNGGQFIGISREKFETLSIPSFDGTMKAKIERGKDLYVDGFFVGPLKKVKDAPVKFHSYTTQPILFAGPITAHISNRNTDIESQGVVNIMYLEDYYFLLY
jgi:hypothetical protein